jgi:hypothetical protein
MPIAASLEDFCDIIKALQQSTELSMPGQPKSFIVIRIFIATMTMAYFSRTERHNWMQKSHP